MALKLDKFFEMNAWELCPPAGSMTKVELSGGRALKIVVQPLKPTKVLFHERGYPTLSIEYIDGKWVGDAPMWPELYDVRALIEKKLGADWITGGSTCCTQIYALDNGSLLAFILTYDGLLVKLNGATYTLRDSLPEEVMGWLLT